MVKRFLSSLLALMVSVGFSLMYPHSADAFVSATGTFTADAACPALSSIRLSENPGNINITPEAAYPLLGKNKPDATYYQIQIEGASPSMRWVDMSCGRISSERESMVGFDQNHDQNYILAASWQPGFCETKPNKPECISQTSDRFDATSFSIH